MKTAYASNITAPTQSITAQASDTLIGGSLRYEGKSLEP
jgi:hypothetical protein